jgi:hypothetical protein
MDRDFEKFIGGPNLPAQYRLRVTLSKTRVLSFNRRVYQEIGKPEAVYLYFSRTRDTIAVEPAGGLRNDAFPVLSKGPSGYRVNVAPFCRHFNIVPDETLRFVDPDVRNGKLLLKLRQTISATQPRRKKAAR